MSGRVERSLWGCDEKGKITERRERIVAGFDSDSEAEMVKTEPVDVEREQEQDELDSGEEREKDSSPGPSEKKRDASPDDDVSGEVSSTQQDTADEKLLELASGPPKKKNKPFAPAPATTPVFRHPKPFLPRNNVGPRSSLPATLQNASPTPNTSLSHLPARLDPYTTPLQSLIASLPSTDIQAILFNAVFTDPLLTEGVSLLQPQFQEDFRGMLERRNTRLREGDATTLANAFAFLAVALRILPKETSDLLLASTLNVANGAAWTGIAQPRSLPRIISPLPPAGSDPTPLDQRYFDLALLAGQIAEQSDSPSVMLIMLKLVLYRYCMIRRDRLVLASGWLAQAVKVAQALGMGKEWEGIPLSERELRRRVMWSLYVADRSVLACFIGLITDIE